MTLRLEAPARPTRFSWILQGAERGPDPIFDEDLASYPDVAVIPTRGAMVAEWMLVVPRFPALSIAALEAPTRRRILRIADDASAHLSAQTGSSVLFEHGPSSWGNPASCGVDQAHIHVIGAAAVCLDALMQQVGEVRWEPVDHDDPWASITEGSDYLLLRDHLRAVVALVDRPVSQRLRKAVAALLDRPDEWDYRLHPHTDNARRTKLFFGSERARAA